MQGDYYPVIANRFREIVKENGGVPVIASILGVTDNMVYRYIRGDSKVSFEQIAALHNQLGISIDWLISGEGSKYVDRAAIPHDDLRRHYELIKRLINLPEEKWPHVELKEGLT